ncbi:MAG: hypothetical protein OEU26_34730 [Candidatus Tectomicrobia bacterium]|nr:hypothetical protein [Candidatus Tectomicrobia bacterium]
MSGTDELEQYERTEAQDIMHLFKAAKPVDEVRAPPDFRLKLMRKIAERRERPRAFAWRRGWFQAAFVPALAALLVLSLGGNAWFMARTWWTPEPVVQQTASRHPAPSRQERPASAHDFQAKMIRSADLGALVAANSTVEEQMVAFGFAPKSVLARSYFLGTLYAEALAYTRSGDTEAAAGHWAAIRKEVEPITQPLAVYARQMETLLLASADDEATRTTELVAFMALFEPLYEDYASERAAQTLPLFWAGTWLTNMRLAAAIGDKAALQTPATVRYFQDEMLRLEAPKGVLNALSRMGRVVQQDTLADRDVKVMLKLVKRVQELLG